jgi:glycerophosphoryl diester phosphodiesterase
MGTHNRRTFLKGSAMLTATAAASRMFLTSATGSPNIASQLGADHHFFAQGKNLEVIAHRGGNGQWPGETMYAMRQAMKIGTDILEMDIYRTKDVEKDGKRIDGELVLMHDIKVNKTTPGNRLVYDYDLEEIQKLNAGFHWSPDGGTSHPYNDGKNLSAERPNDLRVPTLEEVFEEFPHTRMVIEMKLAPQRFSPVKKLCELIKKHKMQDRVLVASLWPPFMNEFRILCPEVATSATISLGDLKETLGGLESYFAQRNSSNGGSPKPIALQIPYQLVTERLIKRVRELNRVKGHDIKVQAWTVNGLVEMNLMKTLGVDGIITDYPGPLLALMDRTQPA